LLLAGALLAGCFDPEPPVFENPPDAPPPDDGPPVDPFAYITLAPGYGVSVFQDFSAPFVFDANDWPEQTEVHDNQPRYLFPLSAPFPATIGVIAGREILLLDGNTVESHDFGNHPRNTAGQADNLTGAVLVPDFAGVSGPALVVSSSSEDTGDGLFAIDPQWAITLDLTVNNTRSVLYDANGVFDATNTSQRYLGHQGGLVRRSDQMTIVTGDVRSMKLVDENLYVTKTVATGEQLVRIASTTHTQTVLAERRTLRISDGVPAPGAVAWAIANESQLVMVRSDGTLDVVAELTDTAYLWTSATVPPAGHPQAGRVYVLESHRGNDVDRVLAIDLP
jgi:hypothetical protein